MTDKQYSYETQPAWLKGKGDWRMNPSSWDNVDDAIKAADDWKNFMLTEGNSYVSTRVVEILINSETMKLETIVI